MYIKIPMDIENKSFDIIRSNMVSPNSLTEDELKIVMRMIHTTGDYGYEDIVEIKNKAIEVGVELFRCGAKIFTDTNMVLAGINKKTLESLNSRAENYISSPEAFEKARLESITRSMASIDMAVESGADIFAIGNAPTALFRLGEHIESGRIRPKLIIGVPVGFVGAEESKEYIRTFDIPTISTVGTKGGSNVAAAVVNALMYMVDRK